MRKSLPIIFSCLGAAAVATLVATETRVFSVLKSAAPIGKQSGGFFLLPTNQLLRPWGEQTVIEGRPVDMTFDSVKRILAVLDTRSVVLFDGSTGARLSEIRARATSYTGVAFRPGDRELWASEATRNGPDSILVAQLNELGLPGKTDHIELKGHPVPTGIAFAPDGKTVYVAFSRNNTLAVIDAATHEIRREVEVGMAPFGVAVAKGTGRVFVTNRGGRRPKSGDTIAPSSGSEVITDPMTGATTTGSITAVDPETWAVREAPVGLAPSALTLSPDEKMIAVANSHSDSISLVDAAALSRTDVKIPSWPAGTFGSQPIGVVFAPDGKTVYVACGGNNALAVVQAAGKSWKVEGALPTAWFPTAIAIGNEGALRVLNIKGIGNTANSKGSFNSKEYQGSLERIPPPAAGQLKAGTREVAASNSPVFEPAGGVANLPSLGIKHVFFIIKENRTYDQVLGDLGKGNGDASLCMFGRDVTPNHHRLTEKYVVLDNFQTSGAISFDGHQWLMQAFVSDYVERAFAASPRGYAWNMADALTVSPAGFFWQHAPKPLDVRIYGEFQLPARFDPASGSVHDMNERDLLTWTEYWNRYKDGTWPSAVGARSGVPALQSICSRRYPNNTTSMTDQIRAEEYLRELAEREKSGEMPNLSVITLTADHTNGTRPGSPTPRAMVADDDLALGRIVEGISKSRFWKQSLILVVEDDAQDGLDHVDGHRTVALAIGPNVRRATVDSNFYNHTSMVRTIQDIFGIPANVKFLQNARAMTSIFTAQADTSAYECVQPKVQLDEMNPPLKALAGRKLWAAQRSLAMNWNHPDDIPEDVLNRILWWDAKGYDKPYPKER